MTTRHPLLLLLLGWLLLPCMAQAQKLEAEQARYSACQLINDSKYSGGKALELTMENARITFTFNAAKRAKYTIYVGHDTPYGDKVANLSVNGSASSFQMKGHGETATGTHIMNEGQNTIVITPSWTWFRIDYIRLEESTGTLPFDIAPAPVDPQATASARELYTFLLENFGRKTISGMMTGEMGSANGNITQHADMRAVYQASGKYPALVGFDFMNATGRDEANGWMRSYTREAVDLAKDTWRRGGLPAFTWHWRDPSRLTGEFYTSDCKGRISQALNADGSWNTGSTLYKNIIKDIHTVADYLLELQREGVACIFRPLHEASGGWFWWGCEGAEKCVKLFRLVIDEMTTVKGVHNVIWVWNAGDRDSDWNPGDNYFDVVSADIYNADFDYSSNYVSFDNLKALTRGKKLIALSENGPLPDIDKEFEDEAVWSWWMPWYQTWGGNFVNKTSKEEWKKCMNDERVITLEDHAEGWQQTSAVSAPTADVRHPASSLFNLHGQLLTTAPHKGIYIKGNKKIIVR